MGHAKGAGEQSEEKEQMIANAVIAGVGVDSRAYLNQTELRGSVDYPVSSSLLREFSRCPARWVAGYQSPESKSMDWGSLLDTRLLTPEQFNDRYAVKPVTYTRGKSEKPWRANAKECRDWLKAHLDKSVVSSQELKECDEAVKRFTSDDVISAFLDASDKQVELRGEWHDEKTGIVIPLKALVDLVPRKDTEFMKCLGDLKSSRNASLLAWQRWCFQAGYHIQASFNTDLYVAATGEDRNTFCFVVQENFPPWQTAKRMLSQDFLELGRAEYTRLLGNYCLCLKHNKWPDYDDNDESVQGWSIVAPEPFMAERAAFAPKYQFEPANSDEPPEEESEDIPT